MDESGPVKSAQDSKESEGNELEQLPGLVVSDVKQHEGLRVVTERVEGSENKGSYHGAEERAPHGLHRKVVTDLNKKRKLKRDGD